LSYTYIDFLTLLNFSSLVVTTEFKNNIDLNCPICADDLTKPIYLCLNGHKVWGKCHERIKECVECRNANVYIVRNITLENLVDRIKYICDSGCQQPISISEMPKHLTDSIICIHRFFSITSPD